MTTSTGVYVPPHLRNRSVGTAAPTSIPPLHERNATAGPLREVYSAPTARTHRNESTSYLRTPSSDAHDPSHSRSVYTNSAPAANGQRPGQGRRPAAHATSPTLYVFGDSFTGPFKLLAEDCVKVTTYKGSSAKGLNNPNSIKQVSRDLLPSLNGVMAPPAYAYIPTAGRWALLLFGNVDLQINYLWQLQHKPISKLSFPSAEDAGDGTDDECPHAFDPNVLASATETTMRGPALGPDLFVEKAIKGYTAWLDREIINGPTGQRLQERANDNSAFKRKSPGKILIAGALPPLVDDETLYRIPEKYVDRLEGDHAKTQQALERDERFGQDRMDRERVSKTPWSVRKAEEDLEVGLSTMTMTDEAEGRPSSPKSTVSSVTSSGFESSLTSSTHTALTSPASTPRQVDPSEHPRATIQDLLQHDPPLCTLSTRIYMTNRFNSLLRDYCEKHPDILAFVDITESVVANNASETPTPPGQADRGTWACPVDPTNIHPLWEPTLPLWLEEIGKQGVPVSGYKITEDAEETFKAYELDKKRRTGRTKLRDE